MLVSEHCYDYNYSIMYVVVYTHATNVQTPIESQQKVVDVLTYACE